MTTPSVVQYVVVRGDLLKQKSWNLGALIAQACHASSAAIHLFYEHPDTKVINSTVKPRFKRKIRQPDFVS